MTDLFNIPETPSPRLAWLKKHDVRTGTDNDDPDFPWAAWSGEGANPLLGDPVGFGETEADAILELARKLNIPLWNEEGFKR